MKPFHFKQFSIQQDQCAMKVTLDACLFGAICTDSLNNQKNVTTALDIGSGTGLLSLMLAQSGVEHITGVELDKPAAEQAQANVLNSPFRNQINIVQKDINEYHSDNRFDLILSNPPFFSNQLKGPSQTRNQARHNDGLSFEALSKVIKHSLNENGTAWILLPCDETERFFEYSEKQSLYCHQIIEIKSQKNKTPHRAVFSLKHDPLIKTSAVLSTITIKNQDLSDYSDEFKTLLKDYYIKL